MTGSANDMMPFLAASVNGNTEFCSRTSVVALGINPTALVAIGGRFAREIATGGISFLACASKHALDYGDRFVIRAPDCLSTDVVPFRGITPSHGVWTEWS